LIEGLISEGFEEAGTQLGSTVLVRNFEVDTKTRGVIEDAIEVTIGPDFPYVRPRVRSLFGSTGISWHLEKSGALCLWPADNSVADLPWKDLSALITRIEEWLRQSVDGWKGDLPILDLERYFGLGPEKFVIPDSDDIPIIDKGYFYVNRLKGNNKHFSIGDYLNGSPATRRPRKGRRASTITYGAAIDLGEVDRPFSSWIELRQLLPADFAEELISYMVKGVLEILVVRYTREGHDGVSVLMVNRSDGTTPTIVCALEPVPSSRAVRLLRAGVEVGRLAEKSVAIVGVGAIGSHVADLLIRRGVGRVTLIDSEDMRPGNAVRHLVGAAAWELSPKVEAVAAQLRSYGFVEEGMIETQDERIQSLTDAETLLETADLVVDATASGECSALLSDLGEETAPVVAVALQRDGSIYRVDRYPAEGHYPTIETLSKEGASLRLESGCVDPISPAAPDAAIEAAIWATRMVVDQLLGTGRFGPSVIGVIEEQPDPPLDQLGLVES
jgi:molybdopterin/thiamine biosynthesis adenylyltransferase